MLRVSIVLLLLGLVNASHFAFGTLSWVRKDEPYEFTVNAEVALRLSYYSGVTVDTPLRIYAHYRYLPEGCPCDGCQWVDGSHFHRTTAIGNYGGGCAYDSNGQYWCNYYPETPPNDCDYTYNNAVQLTYINEVYLTPKQIYSSDDYFSGTMSVDVTIPNYELSGWVAREERWWFYLYGYARINSLIDGNSGGYLGWQMGTILDPGFTSSPFSTGFPREYAALGYPWTFQIPAVSPDSLPMTYALAPSGAQLYTPSSGLANAIPGSTYGNPMEFDDNDFENTGIITWTPTTLGLHGIQVIITDSNGIECPLDFIVEVIDLC